MAEASDDRASGGQVERRAANRALLEHVISLFGTGRAGELSECYTPDWVLELPFADPPVRLEGGREIGNYLASRLGTFVFTLSLTTVHECLDPDLLVVEYESDGHVTHTGRPYRNTYIALWRFRDGKVCGVKEFPNPMVAAEALIPVVSGSPDDFDAGDGLPDEEEE
ncbi:MAG: nuclear transport factor 2 family protein [Acidimicrobiales bacterium]|nr:nuclear transport factor 2 family protein [Acidimicrobiales bacterium]